MSTLGFGDRLKKMLEDAGSGRPSTFTMVIILIAEGQLNELAASADGDGETTAAGELGRLFSLTKRLARHADTALEYGGEVVRSGHTSGAVTRDAHFGQFNTVQDELQQLLVKLRGLIGMPF